ncbi:2-hydroxyacid dehydrogenase [Radicibacter daui]|uniref:2-hydroxyacid dehydrogenase n=1 Tax=Radicibacter daui TaxID=3064829 RepID=UPI0040469421
MFEIAFTGVSKDYDAAFASAVTCHDASGGVPNLPAEIRARITALVTTGVKGATAADMDALPNLRLICCAGTGYEGVDLAAANDRKLPVTYGAGTNAPVVADHAMGLLIAAIRRIPQNDAYARAGGWRDTLPPRPVVSGRKLGIFGMGMIGRAIARRAEGFDITVSYCSRSLKPELPYRFVPTLLDLAAEVDDLICVAPGGPETRHAVNGAVLEALGPKGYLVNAGRGSIVDTAALIEALSTGKIAGAALDVFEDEPDIPAALREHPDVVLSPHIAGVAIETQAMSVKLVLDNIRSFLETGTVLTPVPGSIAYGA